MLTFLIQSEADSLKKYNLNQEIYSVLFLHANFYRYSGEVKAIKEEKLELSQLFK